MSCYWADYEEVGDLSSFTVEFTFSKATKDQIEDLILRQDVAGYLYG